jgi:glycosyltransferase involved in cell wall biosynthesis
LGNITATIITLNEEKRIRDCIISAKSVCDEIIVVDSLSKDNTVAEAKKLGARVYLQEYLGDGPQKDYGVQFAKNDWILSLDADERLEADAVAAIKSLELDKSKYQAYALKRRNYVGSHWIKAAGFYPDVVTRLYNKNVARYLPKKAHSSVEAKKTRKLNAHIRHLTYDNYTHWFDRINRLSSRDAWAMCQRGVKVNSATPVLHATVALLRKLIFKGGIFQGVDGFTVAITTAFHAYMKYIKLLELYEDGQNH